jgi:predicted secreted protein
MPEFTVVDYPRMLQCAKDANTEPNAKVYLNDSDITSNSFELYTSKPFTLVYAEENPYEDTPGNYTGVGGGYYIFLKPLSPGEYELHYSYDRQIAAERGDAKYRFSVTNASTQ